MNILALLQAPDLVAPLVMGRRYVNYADTLWLILAERSITCIFGTYLTICFTSLFQKCSGNETSTEKVSLSTSRILSLLLKFYTAIDD